MATNISTGFYTHRGHCRDGSTVLMRSYDVNNWNQAKKQGYGSVLIIRDLDGVISFHAIADLIEKIEEINIEREQRIAKEKQESEKYYQNSLLTNSLKHKWTDEKMKTITATQYNKLHAQAKKDGIVGENHIRNYIRILIRKHFNCPYK